MQYLKLIITSLSLCSITANVVFANNNPIFEKNVEGVVVVISDDGVGTGTVITKSGYVLTNWHVITYSKELYAVIYGMDSYEEAVFGLEVIKFDQKKDLALLRIINPPSNLSSIKVSRVIPKVGTEVHAIGHPNGEIWSYSQGYISQIRYDYEWEYDDSNIEYLADVYQTQTPFMEGSSGGPLLNNSGNLVGMNTFGSKLKSNLNFSITVEEIIEFLTN